MANALSDRVNEKLGRAMEARGISHGSPRRAPTDEELDMMRFAAEQQAKESAWEQQYGGQIEGLEQPWIDPVEALAGGLTAIPKGLAVAGAEMALDPAVGFAMERAFEDGSDASPAMFIGKRGLKKLGVNPERDLVGQFSGLWDKGVRAELDDTGGTFTRAFETIKRGGKEPASIEKVNYLRNSDGTYDLTLTPKNPQKTSDIVDIQGADRDILEAVLPTDVLRKIDAGSGSPSYIGQNLDDSLEFASPFEFGGMDAMPMGKAYSNEQLYLAHPELADITATVDKRTPIGGSYGTHDGDPIITTGIGQQRNTVKHELQHAVQEREGFARGGSPSKGYTEDVYSKSEKLYQLGPTASNMKFAVMDGDAAKIAEIKKSQKWEDLQSFYDELGVKNYDDAEMVMGDIVAGKRQLGSSEELAMKGYTNLAGEWEARNAGARAVIRTEDPRLGQQIMEGQIAFRSGQPFSTADDIPLEDMIVRMK